MNAVTWFRDFCKFLIIITSVLALSACELMQTKEEVEEPVVVEEEVVEETIPQPTDSLTPNQRVRKALDQLQNGDYENAHNQLTWAIQDDPDHKTAKKLLHQMNVDPIEHLGIKNFFYEVQSGDTLSLIAKKFLDDPYQFVILARYNQLDNPRKLAAGQRIRIPGEMREPIEIKARPVKKPKPKPTTSPVTTDSHVADSDVETEVKQESTPVTEAETTANVEQVATPKEETEADDTPVVEETTADQIIPNTEDTISSARQLHNKNDLPAAIYLLESENIRQPESVAIRSLLASYYTEHADQLINQDNLEGARDTLEKLIILDSSDDSAVNKLILVEDKIEAQKLLLKAQNEEKEGLYEKAYVTFGQVLTYEPDNQLARDAQLKVRNQLTDNYHRQAMQLFRKQELDEAIGFWDKILELDPNHSLAPGYKARALEMKQRLQRLDTGTN
jgi:tetratricopeptide (TPR) repeat protein